MSLSLTLWSVWPNFSGSTRNRQLAECPQQSEYTPALLLLHPHPSQGSLLLIPCFPQKALEPQDPAIGQPHKVPLSLLSSPSLSLSSQVPLHRKVTRPSLLNLRARRSCSPGLRLPPHGCLQPPPSVPNYASRQPLCYLNFRV